MNEIFFKTLPNREEWLRERLNGIGGSDASAIMGCNPYMTNEELWEIKTGRREQADISEKECVVYGNNAEPIARELFKLNYPQYKVGYVENNSFQNDKYPFARASLDGWLYDTDGTQGILEIKTTTINNSQMLNKWNDNTIPQNYYCQLLHYFLVLEDAEFAYLTAFLNWNLPNNEKYQQVRNYRIDRIEVLEDIEILKRKEREFWECVEKDIRPDLALPKF